jgi:hypothetical protein
MSQRRLRKEVDEDEHNQGRRKLYSNGTAPLCLALDEEEAVAHELAACDTSRLEAAFDHYPAATALGIGTLRLP